MILPDVNLLLYAYNSDSPFHAKARTWWERLLSETTPVGLAWAAMLGYLRLSTSRTVLIAPFSAAEAIGHVRLWLAQPNVQILEPGPRHLDLLESLTKTGGGSGTVTTDDHLAAIAIEHGAEIASNDTDFRRFPGLRLRNPLAD